MLKAAPIFTTVSAARARPADSHSDSTTTAKRAGRRMGVPPGRLTGPRSYANALGESSRPEDGVRQVEQVRPVRRDLTGPVSLRYTGVSSAQSNNGKVCDERNAQASIWRGAARFFVAGSDDGVVMVVDHSGSAGANCRFGE